MTAGRRAVSRALACALAAAAFAGDAPAQSAEPRPERFYKPQPLAEDFTLPMPCGGAMVFRRVDVPREGSARRRIVIGGDDPRFEYAEASREEYVEGAFTDRSDAHRRYYYIAKYEITALQLAALNGECETPGRELMKPAVRTTWFDAVQAAQLYSEWLLKNARDRLPREDGTHGFLRLPTEAEWEFAARGGGEVSPQEFEATTFPMKEGIEKYVWFGSTRSANGELQIVGALKPNPLGLHDILGNADEIVLESFRLYRASGARGQTGGYVVKGGNYQTVEANIRSSYRQEIPPFDEQGPRRVPTVGFRLALVAAVIPSPDRLNAHRWAAPPPPQPPPVSKEAMELAAWNAVSRSSDPAVFEAFLKRFPDGVYAGIARARIEELRTKAAAENTRRLEDDKRRLAMEQERRAAADRARQEDQARRDAQARQDEQARQEERTRKEEEERRVAAAEQARRLRAQIEEEEARRRAAQPPRITPGQRAAFMGRCVYACRNDDRIPSMRRGACADYCDCVVDEDERQFSAADHAQMKADSRAGYLTPKLRQFQGIFAACHYRVFGR